MKLCNIKNSPYHFCKAKLIGNVITSQEILVENIKNDNEFILNNISLSVYAKLGGIPWTVERIDTQKTELIIGISSSFDRNNKRIFGVSQVFESANKNGLLFIWAEYGFGKCDKFYKKIKDFSI